MAVSKLPSGKWLCQCFPYGRDGKRVRKQFVTKGEALSYERGIMGNKTGAELGVNAVTLKELIKRWYEMHGQTLDLLLNKNRTFFRHFLGSVLYYLV